MKMAEIKLSIHMTLNESTQYVGQPILANHRLISINHYQSTCWSTSADIEV